MVDSDMQRLQELFRQESAERFDDLEHDLLQLEQNPGNRELIHTVMRHVHSLKGSAGMFGYSRLKSVAHRLEDLLQTLHESPGRFGAETMNVLLEGRDVMQNLFSSIASAGHEDDATARDQAFLARLERATERAREGGLSGQQDILELLSFVDEVTPLIGEVVDTESVRAVAGRVRAQLSGTVAGNESPLPFSSIQSEHVCFGGVNCRNTVATLNSLLERAFEETLSTDEAEQVYALIAELIETAGGAGNEELAPILQEARDDIETFRSLDLEFDDVQAISLKHTVDAIVAHADTKTKSSGDEADLDEAQRVVNLKSKAVRIEESKIDGFLDSVGELIILAEVFNNLQKRIATAVRDELDLVREFSSANALFANHTFSLREALMEVRRVALRNLTGGLERLVRDTAHASGKEVRLTVQGEDASLDKSLLEQVNTCLVHLVRNAIDHGIEPPEERSEKGKPRVGHVGIAAVNESGNLILTITDDGRGIDHKRLLERAIETGRCTPADAAAMSVADAHRLIFSDGLSTARELSDVSGRGVGMGAVLDSIERIGGGIDIDCPPEGGTIITLRVPLSIMLSVVEGLVVRASGQQFVIPIRHVEESLSLVPEQIETVRGRDECVNVRDSIVPVRRLNNLLRLEDGNGRDGRNVGILVQNRRRRACLVADDIMDHQQVVIKRIGGLARVRGVLGGALLGDGTVGLVLDIDALLVD